VILPDLPELIGLRSIARPLTLGERRPALAHTQGQHRSVQRGRGLEFEEVRPYVAGDDARHIDWRVTARRGRLHTRVFREERERPIWLLADLHAGLFFGSRTQLKSALLVRAAALLGWVSLLEGDRVGAVIASTHAAVPILLRPRPREAGLLPVLEHLVHHQPQQPGFPDANSLSNSVSLLLNLVQPGSLICLLSDFSHLNESAEQAIQQLSVHSDCRFIQIMDPLEAKGLPDGYYALGLPGHTAYLEGESSRLTWQAQWQQRQTRLNQCCSTLSIPMITLQTTDLIHSVLPALLRRAAR
jgi:uncharacterized protein (DUF58 family)